MTKNCWYEVRWMRWLVYTTLRRRLQILWDCVPWVCGKNFAHIFLSHKSSRRIWINVFRLMRSCSFINFRITLRSLAISSRNFATVSGFQAVDSCPLLGSWSRSLPHAIRRSSHKHILMSVNRFKNFICLRNCLKHKVTFAPWQRRKTLLLRINWGRNFFLLIPGGDNMN
jgi:hypothetical protein